MKRNASQVARAPGAVRGKGFVRVRVKPAGADIPLNGGVELLRVEDLEPGAKPPSSRGVSCSTAFSMSSAVVMSIIWHLRANRKRVWGAIAKST